ncbi:PREDICTED: protein broad-minded isoform X2 [Chinchilla lanigera]|uniref:protein broad-minded isoform X2 n=1 Tax=Chinchilla lanigera TaxID=34839 RepID=UPI0006971AAB|nr:PREDICTED: protein broad-minded isoform X2 [Chinchilla lanigera]
MARVCPGDEARLQAMLRQLFRSVKERITGAPSLECAEEVLLRLEETDDNFHNYEFVKYLRQHISSALGSMIEEEMEKCASDHRQGEEPGYDSVVQHVTERIQDSREYKDMMHSLKGVMTAAVEDMSNGFEEEEMRCPDRQRKIHREKSSSYCTDNCSDSDSSFNQSYKFCPGKLQLIVDQLDPRQPKEVRYEALQTLCAAPPSDVLNCENWTLLCERLMASLSDPDPVFSDRILKFSAQTFTLLPLHMTKEIYIGLVKYLELYFLSRENHIPALSAGIDVTNPNVTRLLKKVRLLSEYQREAPSFWIRHPEKYMEEIVESTLSLLSLKQDPSHLVSPKLLDPIYFFALVDPKAVWFKKWMHAYYSRTTVLKLLEKRYKSLITAAVQQCVQYLELCETMKADEILGHSRHCGDRQKTLCYSAQEVQYVYFIHSLCLLGRLLIYTQGRKLFPVKLKNRKDLVSLTDLLVLFTQLIYYSPSCPETTPDVYSEDCSPASTVLEILQTLCDQKECAVECLHNSAVIGTLLQPIHNAAPDCSETAFIHAADILARIASVEEGLALLLYGENTNSSEEESPPGAHVIAQFTKRLLDEEISVFPGSALQPAVQGAFVSVCCQMYGTCEGLQALLPYNLHESIAQAWRKTRLLSESVPAPMPGSHAASSVSQGHRNAASSVLLASGSREVRGAPKTASTRQTAAAGKGREPHGHPCGQAATGTASAKQMSSVGTKASSQNVSSTKFDEFQSTQVPSMACEENLLDDLLNFAATPKGLLLLQRTGVINECVTFMSNQYAKNLQVSRRRKADRGVVLAQVASTAAGAAALRDSGFVSALVAGLWSSLECGGDDVRVTHPRSTPVDPIDRSCQKAFLALVSLLSSPAAYELLGLRDLPNRAEYSLREVPAGVTDIIDRLIILNSEAKIHSLFNYEQSHIFGLRLLSVMCCGLDTLLLLETQYQVSRVLLRAQEDNVSETSASHGGFIIDGLSVERNHVLVRMNLIGGPSERTLPPRTLEEGDNPYPWPMFSSYPLPHCYLSKATRNSDTKQDGDLGRLSSCFTVSEKQTEWIENCRRQFCKMMKAKCDIISSGALGELLEKFVLHLTENPSECYFPSVEYTATDADVKNESLSSVQQLGVRMAVRYGKFLNLLKDGAENDLALVLKHCERFLKQQQAPVKSSLLCLQGAYAGHDWFASSLFLLMSGDREKTLRFLQRFSRLLASAFLWLPRLHVSRYLPVDTVESGIHPTYFCSAHCTEMLLKTEAPLVSSAFHMSGFAPSQICLQWITQCFWNYLDWIEICHYIATCIFLGPDYQVYICVAIFKHLQQEILHHTQAQDLQVFLKEEALRGFRVSDYFEYMEMLEQNYRPALLRDMRSIRVQTT